MLDSVRGSLDNEEKRAQVMLPPNGGNGFRQLAWEGLLRLTGGLGCQFNGGLTR